MDILRNVWCVVMRECRDSALAIGRSAVKLWWWALVVNSEWWRQEFKMEGQVVIGCCVVHKHQLLERSSCTWDNIKKWMRRAK